MEISTELEDYMERHTEREPEVLAQLAGDTYRRVLRPRMLSGNMQGQFLRMLCRMTGARRVLEIGTFTGYSAIAMAMGMEEGSELHTIDVNDELEELVLDYIRRSGLEHRIVFHVGDAREVIRKLEGPFDLVFIDADKRQYAEYYRLIIDKVRAGGVIVADDVLWEGKVIDTAAHDPQTRGILEFNDLVQADSRVENVLFPIRHGLMLIRKK